jgi:ATP-dependent exoDNAse (exonuclease V) alpha subunit
MHLESAGDQFTDDLSAKVVLDGFLPVMDSGRDVQFNIREHPHLDYGYAVTSHSSQGVTADRVLVHVDTEQAHERLINSRLAYASVSPGRCDAQIYTNDAGRLGEELSREVSKESALDAAMNRDHGNGHTQEESRAEAVSRSAELEREEIQEQSMEH